MQYPSEEVFGFPLDHLVESSHFIELSTAAQVAMEISANIAKTIAIGREHEGMIPSQEFTSHGKYRTIRCHCTFLFKYVDGCSCRVENDKTLVEDSEGYNVT